MLRARGTFDPLWTLLIAGAAYLLAGQRTLYGVDGWRLLRRLETGDLRSDMHLLYKPLAAATHRLLDGFGFSLQEAVVVFSGIGTAVGVAACHAAALRLGTARREAALVAALVGTAPGVAFYATVVERHGPFFAFYGLATLAGAQLARRPGVPAALGVALATTLCYAAHSTGFLVLGVVLPLWAWCARQGFAASVVVGWPRIAGLGALSSLATIPGMLGARQIGILAGTVENSGANLDFFVQHAGEHLRNPQYLAVNLWQELLQPFLPMSVLAWRVLGGRHTRAYGWVLLGAGAVYWAISFAILGGFGERGAYALPLAWPLALAVLLSWPRTLGRATVLAALLFSLAWIVQHDTQPLRGRAAGMRAAAGQAEPYLVAASPRDFATLWGYFPEARSNADFYDAFDAHGFPAALLRENAARLVQALEELRAGRPLLLSEDGRQVLARDADPGKAGPLVLEVLQRAYRFEPVEVGDFRGYRLVRRD